MGAVEDTFTKQEIQAGYVTSGRDVLARQQQIVQQALSASHGPAGTAPRRKVGGGGPSSTGKGSSNPVFPAPEFDEPAKATTLMPAPTGMSRAASAGTGFPTVAAAAQHAAAKPITRAASTGASGNANVPTSARKDFLASATGGVAAAATFDGTVGHAPQGATAASVVAGVHSVSGGMGSAPSPHTTLTPLTPLKRATKPPASSKPAVSDTSSLSMPAIGSNGNFPKPPKTMAPRPTTTTKNQSGAARGPRVSSAPGTPPSPGLSSTSDHSSNYDSNTNLVARATLSQPHRDQKPSSLSSLGGEVIAPPDRSHKPAAVGPIGSYSPARGGLGSVAPVDLSSYNGGDILSGQPTGLSGLGGEVFNGPLTSSGPKAAIGSRTDKCGASQLGYTSEVLSTGGVGGQPIGPAGSLWANSAGAANRHGVGGSSIGSSRMVLSGGVIGNSFGAAPGPRNSGSSALASILGINLPTGSGSLHETTNLWPQSNLQQPQPPVPVSSLHGLSIPSQGVIGRSNGSSGLIGGVPIAGNPIGIDGAGILTHHGAIGGGSNKSDIALLQSLLPEVHITGGNGVPPNGWNAPGGQQPLGVGAVGRNMSQQAQTQGTTGNLNIW